MAKGAGGRRGGTKEKEKQEEEVYRLMYSYYVDCTRYQAMH